MTAQTAPAVRRLTGLVSAAAGVALLLGCSAGAGDGPPGPGPGPDLTAPTPGTAPLPATREALDAELRALIPRLAPAPEGSVAAQKDVLDACLRLTALDLHIEDPTVERRLDLEGGERVLVKLAEGQCSSGELPKAAAALRSYFEFRDNF